MPRAARIVMPGVPHYVVQRGHQGQPVFFQDEDYDFYIELLAEWCAYEKVKIWAYCLLENQVHMIAVPKDEKALARAIGEAHRRYSVAINEREGWTGNLWHGRFASFAMDNPTAVQAARHIDRLPVEEQILKRADLYKWSSARAHIKGKDDELVSVAELNKHVKDWRALLRKDPDNEFATQMKPHETGGWPMGNSRFLTRLEKKLGRPMKPAPRGRPRKSA